MLPIGVNARGKTARLLFVSLARHKGIPARMRVGFAAYFHPGLLIDHVVAEAWDEAAGRAALADRDELRVPATVTSFDPYGAPRARSPSAHDTPPTPGVARVRAGREG
jgi:hypothetical protein